MASPHVEERNWRALVGRLANEANFDQFVVDAVIEIYFVTRTVCSFFSQQTDMQSAVHVQNSNDERSNIDGEVRIQDVLHLIRIFGLHSRDNVLQLDIRANTNYGVILGDSFKIKRKSFRNECKTGLYVFCVVSNGVVDVQKRRENAKEMHYK